MNRLPLFCRVGVAATVVAFVSLAGGAVLADEVTLHAKLIWGANGEKPNDPKVQAVDTETATKLAKVFKWQSYYEVSRTNFVVVAGSSRRIQLSPKCDVEVEYLGASNVNVKLYGKGKMVVCKRQTITTGELAVVAGPDKDDTAWFVVLRREKN